MPVECNFFGPLRESVGTKTVEHDIGEGTTVADLAMELAAEYDALREELLTEDGDLQGNVNVTVDGNNIRQLSGVDTVLEDGMTVRFAPPVVGG